MSPEGGIAGAITPVPRCTCSGQAAPRAASAQSPRGSRPAVLVVAARASVLPEAGVAVAARLLRVCRPVGPPSVFLVLWTYVWRSWTVSPLGVPRRPGFARHPRVVGAVPLCPARPARPQLGPGHVAVPAGFWRGGCTSGPGP